MTINELSDIYSLYVSGIGVGVLLSAFPFIVGYVINFFFNLIHKNV